MLSCNELCAADILASFNLSQSTLSYHMKILIDAGVVNSQRNGLWTRYSINEATFADILDILLNYTKLKMSAFARKLNTAAFLSTKRSVTMRRWIMHVDMDAFFASIEQLDHPEYKGHPVIVGGLSSRGVVATCSYEARKFGVHSAMPISRAKKLCPDGIYVYPRMDRYKEVSNQIFPL